MSRLFVASPGRERYAPADRAQIEQLIRRLFLLAGDIEMFATEATEVLSFEEYQTLVEQEQRLLPTATCSRQFSLCSWWKTPSRSPRLFFNNSKPRKEV